MELTHHLQRLLVWFLIAGGLPLTTLAQQKTLDGQVFTSYKPGHFKPKRGLNYAFFVNPLLTVDPLGFGGKSTYAIGAGTQIRLWESKATGHALQGLRIKGLYTTLGYELYPQQYDLVYGSLCMKINTFIPIVARMDVVYSFGYGLKGISRRYCFGVEVKKVAVLLCGQWFLYETKLFGDHPFIESPYANAGAVMLVIPFYNHESKP